MSKPLECTIQRVNPKSKLWTLVDNHVSVLAQFFFKPKTAQYF